MIRYPSLTISEDVHYAFLHRVGLCWLTGRAVALEIEHLRELCFNMGKALTGMAQKPHYRWCVPLAAELHQERHRIGSSPFWRKYGAPMEDHVSGPFPASQVLFAFSVADDAEGAARWIEHSAQQRLAERIGA